MKAVDPTIQVGASGSGLGWWREFLPIAAPQLDFLTVSVYNCWEWKSYDHFPAHPQADLLGEARTEGAVTAARFCLLLVLRTGPVRKLLDSASMSPAAPVRPA